MMGVFFNKQAITFDQAPFFAAAREGIRDTIESYLLNLKDQNGQLIYSLPKLHELAPELLSFTDTSRTNRACKVSGYYVEGEALTTYPYNGFLRIGSSGFHYLMDQQTLSPGIFIHKRYFLLLC